MSAESKELRELAHLIENLTRDHPAYSMSWDIVRNCTDHLQAKAALIERRK